MTDQETKAEEREIGTKMSFIDHLKSAAVVLMIIYFLLVAVGVNEANELKKKALHMSIELMELQLEQIK